MSASAPLGRPSRKTGSVEADCTRATSTGEVVSEVMSQAAATSFIHMQVLAAIQISQSMRKVDRKSTRLNSSHLVISYAVFCLKKKKRHTVNTHQYFTPINVFT